MTDQLHDLLSRLADDAVPAGDDEADLWGRGRRARRRERALRASAVAVLATVALVGALVLGRGPTDAPPPAGGRTPTPHDSRGGALATVHGITGDGGLTLETDLAVGPASVAIATRSGAFVVTAADGVYHRLRLPGYDPAAFDAARPGLALSPDGTKLAYGWGTGARRGTRVLFLRTGRLWRLPDGPPDVHGLHRPTYGFTWSPDSRFLGFEDLLGDPDLGTDVLYAGFDTGRPGATYKIAEATPRSRYFLWAGEARFASCGPCTPLAVLSGRTVARVDGSSVRVAHLVRAGIGYTAAELPVGDWTVGRFAPDGRRLLLQPVGVGQGLVLVTDRGESKRPFGGYPARGIETTRLDLDPAAWPDGATLTVLGWVEPDTAMVLVHRGTGPDSWEQSGRLALVDVTSGADGSPITLEDVGRVEAGDAVMSFHVAVDLASQ